MRAMVLSAVASIEENPAPLKLVDLPRPRVGDGEILIRIAVCGVCHTELDEIEGRMTPSKLPIVPGHEVVGRVVALGMGCRRFFGGAARRCRLDSLFERRRGRKPQRFIQGHRP